MGTKSDPIRKSDSVSRPGRERQKLRNDKCVRVGDESAG